MNFAAMIQKGRQYLARPRKYLYAGIVLAASLIGVAVFAVTPPPDFPRARMVSIEPGLTLTEASELLEEKAVVRSALLLKLAATAFQKEGRVIAGEYFFEQPRSLLIVASRITRGAYGLDPIRVTVPEGSTVVDVAAIFKKALPDFNEEAFAAQAGAMEGRLFPDTYFFLPNVSPGQVIREMHGVFLDKTEALRAEVSAQGEFSFDEVIVMASLLEKEAYTLEDKRVISGILWRRIELGMPLQVDAVFEYINGKNTYQLTLEDLKVDSPYNTYKYRGLPPGPIANPGLESIRAAVDPEESPYLFYLSDRRGNIYYAEDFEKHKLNKYKYLN